MKVRLAAIAMAYLLSAPALAEQATLAVPDLALLAPPLQHFSGTLIEGDLWKRPELSPRDRSLITISALIAGGHAEQLPFHLNRGMDNGLSRAQIAEAITRLAFYAGWPSALSAVPVARAVFDKRPG
jgi:4-carboxymuconolactone decarboxylase